MYYSPELSPILENNGDECVRVNVGKKKALRNEKIFYYTLIERRVQLDDKSIFTSTIRILKGSSGAAEEKSKIKARRRKLHGANLMRKIPPLFADSARKEKRLISTAPGYVIAFAIRILI